MFDSSHVLVDQGKVESEEHGDHNQHTKIHEVADDSQIIGVERSFKSVINNQDDMLDPSGEVVDKDFCHGGDCVEQEEQEEFSIVETDAIIKPWAVMVHVKDASVASRAMMASFGLKDMAD